MLKRKFPESSTCHKILFINKRISDYGRREPKHYKRCTAGFQRRKKKPLHIIPLKHLPCAGLWWLMPVILATWETEIERPAWAKSS
jgi:hypothetical protein